MRNTINTRSDRHMTSLRDTVEIDGLCKFHTKRQEVNNEETR